MNIFSRTKQHPSTLSICPDPEFGQIQFTAVKKVLSIRIYVQPFQGVVVKFPLGLPLKKAKSFVDSKRAWIREASQRARLTEQKSRDHFALHGSISKSEIRGVLNSRLSELALEHGFTFNKVSLRNQKSRWGSCSAQDNISLNQNLYFLPPHLRDYVLVHELAHTKQKNHSPFFWNILFNIFGELETRAMRRELKAYDFLFYTPPG
jgi:predicted metal-dependent hydrolase